MTDRSVGTVLLFISLLILFIHPAGAGEYRQDYDYPNQGDDWYARAAGADPSADYEDLKPLVDTFSDGDDFGRGYDPSFASLNQKVEVLRTNRQQSDYKFRYEATFECLKESDCQDGLVCNGTEVCSDSFCSSGAVPDCDDLDACTDDACLEPTGCTNTLVPPPAEVPQLDLTIDTPGSSVARLTWLAPAGNVEYYNVYRGEQAGLSDLACYESRVVATELLDDGALPGGGVFVHLVSSFNCTQESSIGDDSGGKERNNTAPCP